MFDNLQHVNIAIVSAPLVAAIIAGLFGGSIGRVASHTITTLGVAIAFLLSLLMFNHVVVQDAGIVAHSVYTWLVADGITFEIGFLVDKLSVMMMVVVTFVSLMVHVYTIGYMADDEENWPADSRAGSHSYQRFFSYISLFTFSMLMLVMANNFMQLFFGWEAVGLVSYLLIGFWLKRPSAVYANLKAFLVNRVGDFGFLLGIAGVLMYFNTLDYAAVFNAAALQKDLTVSLWPGTEWSVMTVICVLLFIGAMGKSAQVPLHVWLPDSMEGPTPISALIHAATMVTAGIFMVARMSPLFELSETALSFILVIGAITALFMGFLGIIQNDIKRVVAYSTLSQLGYMTVALGASAYAAGMFHLMTHAFFKALLFLAAGSVIIAMHHEQDIRRMGGLRKYMPITWLTSLIGTLALIGTPGFAGFFSKDLIIEAVQIAQIPGAGFAYFCVLAGVFVTALYSFRMYFLVFHGKERFRDGQGEHPVHEPQESPWVVTLPLIALAIPSVVIGGMYVTEMGFGNFFAAAIQVLPEHDVLATLGRDYHGAAGMVMHSFASLPLWLALAGVVVAWLLYIKFTHIPGLVQARLRFLHTLLEQKYYADRFNDWFFAGGSRGIGRLLWQWGDVRLIDGLLVNGSARTVGWLASVIRHVQSGYLYHYAFVMILGLLLMFALFVVAG